MIVNTGKSTIETVGDIKEFKTGIDPKNLEFITMLLSSNLYSNPQRSFIREIISNAWDSHVEANNTDNPVIVKISSDSITIRDYGVGLSPERFETIFCNIGSSTKRDSNDFIGGFGIGRFSALACSNIVHFTSYYKGTMYQYIMVKDGNKITTNLVNTTNTDEKDGLAVSLININPYDYLESFDFTVFFPNLYIDSTDKIFTDFNSVKIKRCNSYSCASKKIRHKILLGNVLYPCEYQHLKGDAYSFYESIDKTGIVINFNIGEIKVTPNRESIIYDSETIELINNRFIEAKKELYNKVKPLIKKDFDNIFEYYAYIEGSVEYDPIEDKILNTGKFYCTNSSYSICFDLFREGFIMPYKGRDISNSELTIINAVGSSILPKLKAIVWDKYNSNNLTGYYRNHINCIYSDAKILQLEGSTKVSAKLKSYLKESFVGVIVLPYTIDDVKESFKKAIIGEYNAATYTLTDFEEYLCKETFDYLQSKTEKVDFKTDKEFLQWKEDNKNVSVVTSDIILHIGHNLYDSDWTFKCKDLYEVEKECKKFHTGIVFDTYGSSNSTLKYITKAIGYKYITVKSSLYDIIKEQDWSFVISHEYILNELPQYDIIYTIKNTLTGHLIADDIIKMLPDNYQDDLYKLKKINNSNNIIYDRAIQIGKINTFVEDLCLRYKKARDAYTKALEMNDGYSLGCGGAVNDALLYKAMIKQGVRIGYKPYSKIKNNALINFVYGKENN